MNQQTAATTGTNGESTPHDLFALSDEQILEIEPEAQDITVRAAETQSSGRDRATAGRQDAAGHERPELPSARAGVMPQEPPPWLAAQIKDPWAGNEAQEFWNGVQQARQEAAAYRAAFASPEDARALKELYPGGVNEARATAERARLLDDIDRSYFGTSGNSQEQTSAARLQLAQRMLREDPAAFREMVEAGVKVLQEAAGAQNPRAKSLAAAVQDTTRSNADTATASNASSAAGNQQPSQTGQTHSSPPEDSSQMSAYVAFEKAANEELERSVGSAIERTLEQALPNAGKLNPAVSVGATRGVPLQARLAAAVRQDVELALKGDRQLGEQIAQVLAARRFDDDTRAQVVRLLGERAQQLVPAAARRVINEWTQTTLSAHRTRSERSEAAASRADIGPANESAPNSTARPGNTHRTSGRNDPRAGRGGAVDYRKLSDEQILEM